VWHYWDSCLRPVHRNIYLIGAQGLTPAESSCEAFETRWRTAERVYRDNFLAGAKTVAQWASPDIEAIESAWQARRLARERAEILVGTQIVYRAGHEIEAAKTRGFCHALEFAVQAWEQAVGRGLTDGQIVGELINPWLEAVAAWAGRDPAPNKIGLPPRPWEPLRGNGNLAGGGQANLIPEGQRNNTLARLGGNMRRVGMTKSEIAAALLRVNKDRCVPPLSPREVERIAVSIARYEPDQIATAAAEGGGDQLAPAQLAPAQLAPAQLAPAQLARVAPLVPISLTDLVARYPDMRRPVIHGLLRQGETMNIVAAPKIGKSWLVTDLALSIATGRPWLDTFACEAGDVLIIDNELHCETTANRVPKVAAARQISLADVGERIFVQNLRGHWQDIFMMGVYFQSLKPGRFRVIILDAMYRFLPRETDENDNATMANIYNAIDRYADLLGCCFVLIHHTSKGTQSGRVITDVGAGAGAQSRATDTHLILRPHEEDGAVVLEAAVRSWPPVAPKCLRWAFPVWLPADDLDPTQLRTEKLRRASSEDKEPAWDVEHFVAAFVGAEPKLVDAILVEANRQGINDFKCRTLLRKAEAVSLAHRWDMGRGRLGYATQAPPPSKRRRRKTPRR
jgi:hypothetical protein